MKYFSVTLTLAVLLATLNTGCFGSKKKPTDTQTYTPVKIPVKVKEAEPTTPPNKPAEPTATMPPVTPPTKPNNTVTPTKPAEKPINLAILLPFSAQYYSPTVAFDSLPDKSASAVEFYEGVLTGIDYLKTQGFTPNIQVYDTQNNVDKVLSILSKPELKQATLIIGPLYNGELKPVATFCKENKIYLLSPNSPSNQITTANPYYVALNPSIETHCEAIYNYVQKTYSGKRIVAIAGNKTGEIALSKLFPIFDRQASKEKYGTATVFNHTYTGTENIESYLSATQQNVVVVTSFTELTAVDLVNKLYALRKKYDITLFGMPTWVDMENLDLSYLAALDYHYTTEFWINDQNTDHNKFKQNFFYKYGIKPTEFAAKGYDLMLYSGNLLKNFGADRLTEGIRNKTSNGIYTQYYFEPMPYNAAQPNYLENKYINIIQYRSDFVLEKKN